MYQDLPRALLDIKDVQTSISLAISPDRYGISQQRIVDIPIKIVTKCADRSAHPNMVTHLRPGVGVWRAPEIKGCTRRRPRAFPGIPVLVEPELPGPITSSVTSAVRPDLYLFSSLLLRYIICQLRLSLHLTLSQSHSSCRSRPTRTST